MNASAQRAVPRLPEAGLTSVGSMSHQVVPNSGHLIQTKLDYDDAGIQETKNHSEKTKGHSFSHRDACMDAGGRAKHGALAEKARMKGYIIRRLSNLTPSPQPSPGGGCRKSLILGWGELE